MKTLNTKGLTTPKGFRVASGHCGVKASGKPDLMILVADQPCAVAGVFTRSKLPSAPVIVSRRHVRNGHAQAIVCNSGNANAATGQAGLEHAARMCARVAAEPGIERADPRLVLPCSTGVTCQPLPIEKIERGITSLAGGFARGGPADAAAARAIMTTDLAPKQSYRAIGTGKDRIQLGGIAKGSGMIAPNMATMLCFITTDARITPAMMKVALKRSVDHSFNRISVDQHTSPSDTVLIMASGAASNPVIRAPGRALDRFTDALTDLCRDLAYQIAKDGEGATRVIRVRVLNAKTQRDADRIGKAVVDSPLVKTAVHGQDPNWGRITTAAAYSGAALVPDKLSLSIGPGNGVSVYRRGQPATLTAATSKKLATIMAGAEIQFTLDMGLGQATTEWLGCDLSRDYVTINADYTT